MTRVGTNRLIFLLSLAGMVLAAHLWVQKQRNFDQGCWGVSSPGAVSSAPCQGTMVEDGKVFGIPNAALGFAFYFAMAMLSLAKVASIGRWTALLNRLSEALAVVAFLYSGYLVYQQAAVIHAFCALCMTSAGIVVLLFMLHGVQWRYGGFLPLASKNKWPELAFAGIASFGAAGVLLGVLLFIDKLGTSPWREGRSGRELEALVGRSLPLFIDEGHLKEVSACRLDSNSQLDLERLLPPDMPFLGNSNGVSVVVFADPNCGSCREFHPSFLKLADRYGKIAKFYLAPRILWEYSTTQVEALGAAAKQGRYFDLWKRQFEMEKPAGLTLADLREFFRELNLDAEHLEDQLKSVRAEVRTFERKVKTAGVTGTPTIYISGFKVSSFSQSEACLGRLIEALERRGHDRSRQGHSLQRNPTDK